MTTNLNVMSVSFTYDVVITRPGGRLLLLDATHVGLSVRLSVRPSYFNYRPVTTATENQQKAKTSSSAIAERSRDATGQ